MKIVHIIESGGGSADFVLYLVKYLPQHHHIIIYGERTFGNRINDVKLSYSNATFFQWKHVQREISLTKDIKATRSLFQLLRKMDYDLVHVHSSKAGFLGRFVCYFFGRKKVIYTPNGLPFIRTDISPLKVKIYIFLEKTANWLCGKIICCSKSEANELIKKGINCSFINNGTEIDEYLQDGTDYLDTNFTIATVGRATIQKNPFLFNEIAQKFESDPRYKFVWIGGGELEHVLTAKNIKITGWLNKDSVNKELVDANLYISTASWEGLSFAVLEAMNLNKALLLSNCVGNVDLVVNNQNGFIYNNIQEAIDGIKTMNNNLKMIEEFGMNSGMLAAKEFNVKFMANQYEIEYEKIINHA